MEVVIFLMIQCVLNMVKNLNINGFNMITRINDLKTLTKYILCEFKCNDGRKCNSN